MSDIEDDTAGVPLLESLSPSPDPTSTKRKRETEAPTESKRAAKRRKSKKPKDIADDALDLEAGLNHAIAHMDSQLLADHIAQRTKRFQTDLSLVELDDLRIPGKRAQCFSGTGLTRGYSDFYHGHDKLEQAAGYGSSTRIPGDVRWTGKEQGEEKEAV